MFRRQLTCEGLGETKSPALCYVFYGDAVLCYSMFVFVW
jgi:hypothetical protein